MQPGRKGRLSAEGPYLAEELQKSFLHEVFRIGRVIHHAQAQSVNAAAMQVVQKLKSRSISGLGQRGAYSPGEFPGSLRASRLDHSPAIAVIRLWRITRWREGTPAS